MNTHGIVVAAGRGERFGKPKAHLELSGTPLWEWARRALVDAGVAEVTIVGDGPGWVPGGARRRDSVRAGLDALPADVTHVLIHDAARPLASVELVQRVIDRLAKGDATGVVPVAPVVDTLKRVDSDDRVVATEPRADLYSAQTPQGFEVGALRAAHEASDDDASDDAALVEQVGGVVVVVDGDPGNLKITYPVDLAVAEELLR